MVIQSQRDMAGLVKIGRVVGMTLQRMLAEVQPGITTGELDAIGASLLKKEGAHSAPILMYKFPGTTCISINDEAAHGIPGKRVVQIGDLVNIDVSAELDGYYADTAATIAMLPVSGIKQRLADVAHSAMEKGISVATADNKVNEIGRAMEGVIRGAGFTVIRDLPGHGVVSRRVPGCNAISGFHLLADCGPSLGPRVGASP